MHNMRFSGSTIAKSFIAVLVLSCIALMGLTASSATATTSVFVPSSSPSLANFPNQSVVDPSGNLWVSSNDNPSSRVTKFAPDGTATIAWNASTAPIPGCADQRNYGIAYANNKIYWTCYQAMVVSIPTSASFPVSTSDITIEANFSSSSFEPCGVAVAPNGDIYANNWGNSIYVKRASDPATTFTQLSVPAFTGFILPMAFGPDGDLYAVVNGDSSVSANDFILKFDVSGGTNSYTTYWTDTVPSSSTVGIAFFGASSTIVIVDEASSIGVRAILPNGDGTGSSAPSALASNDPLLGSAFGIGVSSSGTIYVVITNASNLHAVTKVTGAVIPVVSTTTTPGSPTTSINGSPSSGISPQFAG